MALKVRTTNGWEDVNPGTQLRWTDGTKDEWYGVRYLFEVTGPGQYRIHAFEPPYGIPNTPTLEPIHTSNDIPFDPGRIDARVIIGPKPPEVIPNSWHREVWYNFVMPDETKPGEFLVFNDRAHTYTDNTTEYIELAEWFRDRYAQYYGQRVAGKLRASMRYVNERGWGGFSNLSNEIDIDIGPPTELLS